MPSTAREACQRLATRVLLAGVASGGAGTDWIAESFISAYARVLAAGLVEDPALAAEALILPAEQVLAEAMAIWVSASTRMRFIGLA